MSVRSILKQYSLLIEWLQRGNYITRKKLTERLEEEGFSVSSRTFDRIIQALRDEFGFQIEFDTTKKGYRLVIDEENKKQIQLFLKIAAMSEANEILVAALRNGSEIYTRIFPEIHQDYSGMNHFEPLVKAILEERQIEFTYQKFISTKKTQYLLEPYLLKEYDGRWYLIAFHPTKKWFQTFGIDRISELKINKKKFKRKEQENPLALFENIVGVTLDNKEISEVIFETQPVHAKYIQSLPLHSSQQVIKTNKDGSCVFSIQVAINYELKELFLRMGSLAKVIQPESLVNELKEEFKKALNNYR
jgi:predicted DNA-binding transcriptional regulator YafY